MFYNVILYTERESEGGRRVYKCRDMIGMAVNS